MKDLIKQIRKKMGLTQMVFAERMGISRNMISDYECGKSKPGPAMMKKIALAGKRIGIDVDLNEVFKD